MSSGSEVLANRRDWFVVKAQLFLIRLRLALQSFRVLRM